MSTKLILTSALALAIASPAFAITDANTFPVNGSMQQDTRYVGAATQDNTGVYSGNVTAEAYYTWNGYTFQPGTYWPASTEYNTPNAEAFAQSIICPAGSYCEGSWGEQWHYETTNQGVNSCSTDIGGGFTSDAGSMVIADCYNSGANNGCYVPTHLRSGASVTGRNYYGWGDDTCELTSDNAMGACADGYMQVQRDLGVMLQGATATASAGTMPGANTVAIAYTASANGQTVDMGTLNVGYACSTKSSNELSITNQGMGGAPTKYAAVPNDGGQYCYCQGQSFTTGMGLSEYISQSSRFDAFHDLSESPWRLANTFADGAACAQDCATTCTNIMTGMAGASSYSLTPTMILSAMRDQPDCEPQRIDIAWRGATPSAIAANNAASTWYADDVRTPVEAVTLPGKTFQGWRFLSKENGMDTSTPVALRESETVDTVNGNVVDSYMGNETTYMPYDGPTPTDTPSNP